MLMSARVSSQCCCNRSCFVWSGQLLSSEARTLDHIAKANIHCVQEKQGTRIDQLSAKTWLSVFTELRHTLMKQCYTCLVSIAGMGVKEYLYTLCVHLKGEKQKNIIIIIKIRGNKIITKKGAVRKDECGGCTPPPPSQALLKPGPGCRISIITG